MEGILGGPYKSEEQDSEPVGKKELLQDSGVIHLKYAIARDQDDKPTSRQRMLLNVFRKGSFVDTSESQTANSGPCFPF